MPCKYYVCGVCVNSFNNSVLSVPTVCVCVCVCGVLAKTKLRA